MTIFLQEAFNVLDNKVLDKFLKAAEQLKNISPDHEKLVVEERSKDVHKRWEVRKYRKENLQPVLIRPGVLEKQIFCHKVFICFVILSHRLTGTMCFEFCRQFIVKL